MKCIIINVSKYEDKKYQSFGDILSQLKILDKIDKIFHLNPYVNFVYYENYLKIRTNYLFVDNDNDADGKSGNEIPSEETNEFKKIEMAKIKDFLDKKILKTLKYHKFSKKHFCYFFLLFVVSATMKIRR